MRLYSLCLLFFLASPAFSSSPGTLTTVTGGGVGDGLPAFEASLYQPTSVFVDQNGNLFIADIGNNHIRGVDLKTGIITTVAGGIVSDGALIIADDILGVEASFDKGGVKSSFRRIRRCFGQHLSCGQPESSSSQNRLANWYYYNGGWQP